MSERYKNSDELFMHAKGLMPGGVNSPVRAFSKVQGSPVFLKSGSGSIVTDADDNCYVDFCGSWGPLVLGHVHPAVLAAASEALGEGLSFGACSEREIKLAEILLKAFPEYGRVRFVSSGTEAVMTAIRLARGITGRSKIIKFEGCYHGHADSMLVKAGSGLLEQAVADSAGVPESVTKDTLVVPLDDENTVFELFKKYKNEIAAIIIEPLPANSGLLKQRKKYLEFLREICTSNGAKLIFDEVISGFRFRFGGYMHEVDIVPDIVTLGKIVGGGMPVGAIVAKAKDMEQLAPTGAIYQAGTLSGNPVAMAAGFATLKILSDEKTYQHLNMLGKVLDFEFDKLKVKYSFFNYQRLGSISWLHLSKSELPRSADKVDLAAIELYNALHRKMLDRGYYLAPSGWEVSFLSLAHSKEQISGLSNAFDEIFCEHV